MRLDHTAPIDTAHSLTTEQGARRLPATLDEQNTGVRIEEKKRDGPESLL